MDSTPNWLYWSVLSAVFAAATAVFAKVGLEHIDSDMATLVRTCVILVVLLAFVFGTGKWSNPWLLPQRTWLFLILSALATGASWICYFRALKMGMASNVAAVDKLSVVLVAVFAFVFLGERPTPRGWFGIALVAAGLFLTAYKR